MIEGRLAQANERLKVSNVGVSIEVKGNRLYLRATLPPKPGSGKEKPFQQRLIFGYHANPVGLKLAEQEARKLGVLLNCREFSWEPYLTSSAIKPLTIADWVQKYKTDYFNRRERTPQSETTWKGDYLQVFSCFPPDEPITLQLLVNAITATKPDSRNRKRFVDVLGGFARFVGLEANFKPLKGSYSPRKVTPRNLPSDSVIAEWIDRIPNAGWRYAYGLIATYGLNLMRYFAVISISFRFCK